jgi:hypothetical protein
MSHIVITRHMPNIAAEQVWSAISGLDTLDTWNRTCVKSALESPVVEVGARVRLSMVDGSEIVEEVTSLDAAAHRIAFDVHGVAAPMETLSGEMRITAVGSGCELIFESEYSLKGGILGAALDRLVVRAAIRREHTRMLADLEHHLTTGDRIGKGGARTPATRAA